jgi:hypothetical protein
MPVTDRSLALMRQQWEHLYDISQSGDGYTARAKFAANIFLTARTAGDLYLLMHEKYPCRRYDSCNF